MAENFVPQVDYTSRDYSSIRQDLIDLIPEYAPQWTNRDPADFGMTLLEGFAYMGDLLNYYIDRAANEAFISTASQRESVLQLARLLSYRPTETSASKVTLTFKNSTASAITVPKLTQVSTTTLVSGSSTKILFETDAAVTVPAKVGTVDGAITVSATQGFTVANETIGTSNGKVNQTFELKQNPVINGSTSVVVGGVTYREVPYLIDYQGYDPIYTTYTDADGSTFIVFGDGVSGRIPPNNAVIYCTYRVGGGTSGNVASNTIKFFETPITGLTVLNQSVSSTDDGSAKGGADAESTDSIRINAPLSIKALNRGIALSDYSALTLQVSGIAKAASIAEVYTSVTVFFAPYGDAGVQADNITPTAAFTALASTANTYLADKIPANTTVTFQPPSYVDVNVTVDVQCLPTYKNSAIQTAVSAVINELLDFDNVSFADTITNKDLISVVDGVDGVNNVQVVKLIKNSEDVNYTVTNKAITGGVATLTIGTHTLAVGQTVKIAGVDTTFDAKTAVTAVTATTISYPVSAANVASTAATGQVTKVTFDDVKCNINEIPRAKNIIVNVTGGITS
jgi:hypothetical protein